MPGGGATLDLFLIPSSWSEVLGDIKNGHQGLAANHCLYKSRKAAWVLGQFDFDEILVGVRHLPSYLHSQPQSVKAISVNHYLPQDEHFSLDRDGTPVVNVSSKIMPDWGKTIYQPDHVNISWVHAPTNPEVNLFSRNYLKLLHYRRDKIKMLEHFQNANMTWTEVFY